MIRRLFSLAACAALSAATVAGVSAQSIPSGSYQQSCSGARVRGGELIAYCTNAQGQRVRSSIALNSCSGDIANSNGELTCSGGNAAWRGRRHHHRDNTYGNGNGGYNNGNGSGGYDRGYGNGRYSQAISGSYQSSCSNIRTRGSVISATCTAPNGSTNSSTLDARTCRGGDIINRNGYLACG